MNKFRSILLVCLFSSQLLFSLEPTVTVKIPMRDGLELLTDIYLPCQEAKNLPCILLRLPGGRAAEPWKSYAGLCFYGYAVAIQDTRSFSDQEGKTLPYLSDGWFKHQDGYDTVEWLAKSEYTNGNIGTLGFSAAGLTQVLMAPTAPPSLKCQYIGVAPSSMYHHAIYPGGQLLKNQVEGWLGLYAKDSGVLTQVINQPFDNNFWDYLNAVKMASKVKVPALHYGGWYDTFLQGTLDGFSSRQLEGGEGARGTQKLIIGPWTHYFPLSKKLGDFEVPVAGLTPPFDMAPNHYFDYYLKNIQNGMNDIPAVTYYVMGPFDGESSSGNIWKSSSMWPVPAQETNFYLGEDHKLTTLPVTKKNSYSYLYDPMNPIPTTGGRNLFLESGPKDQREIEKRSDVISFTSDKLSEDLEVTGAVKVKVYFASDRKDTDVIATLTDVYPDGRSILIAEGIYRTGFQNIESSQKEIQSKKTEPKGIEPKEIEPKEIEIDLWSTSLVFAKGHQLRLTFSSSNYPKYEKNLNVGHLGSHQGISHVAKNQFYIGSDYPSRLILPVILSCEKSALEASEQLK